MTVRIGTAGWSLPKAVAASFPGEGSQLARYARVLDCAEIAQRLLAAGVLARAASGVA